MSENNLSFSSKRSLSDSSINSNPNIEQPIYSIIGVGDPIVDIISEISLNMIRDYDLELGGSILANENCEDRIIEVYSKLEKLPSVNYIPGGSVQNTMRVLSWSLNNDNTINRHEYNISMLGSVGEDLYKDKIINALDDIGVNPILEILKNDKTSRCGVGVYQKEKLFVTQLRASKRLSEKYIEDNLDKILEHQALIIEGYLLNNKFDLVKKLCDYFSQNKKLVILTLSASFIVKIRLNEIIELGNKADIIVGSMEEAKEFPSNNIFNTPEDVFKNIFLKLEPKENRLLLITDGPNGAYCIKYNYDTNEFSYKIHIPANKIKDEEIKDLNGAGDAFLGGFLAEYIKGSNIKDCCKNGINAATIIIQNVGCTFPKKFNFEKN